VIIDDEVKETIKQLISMSKFSAEGESHYLLSEIQVKGALFYGPPGTGKTHFCRAMAKESGATMLAIDAATIVSKWVGDSEKYIKAAFSLSAKLYPCILFIDEVESMFYRRKSDDKNWVRTALNQFLQEMDGLSTNKQAPFVVGATNRPSDVDEAFLRRLPQKVLFKLPNLEARIKILRVFLKDGDLDPLVSIEALAEQTEGYSGSDLRSICGQAALSWAMEQSALKREFGDETTSARLKLTVAHFVKALERTMPSVSQRSMEDIDQFSMRFNQRASKVR
jgi:SpoVK/Ycf46/Vps4 family AAA+-type ATPase